MCGWKYARVHECISSHWHILCQRHTVYELACTHTTTHIRTRVHTHTYAYKHEHTQTHTNVHTHAHTNPPTHTHTHHSYVYIRVHILTCIHIWIIHIYSHTLHTQEYTPFKDYGKIFYRAISEMKSLISLKIAEDDLQQKAVEFCDARHSENSKEFPFETHFLNQIAGILDVLMQMIWSNILGLLGIWALQMYGNT